METTRNVQLEESTKRPKFEPAAFQIQVYIVLGGMDMSGQLHTPADFTPKFPVESGSMRPEFGLKVLVKRNFSALSATEPWPSSP